MQRKWGVYGPEQHRKRWRVRLRSPDGEWQAKTFSSKAKAAKYRREVEIQIDQAEAYRRAAKLYANADQALKEAHALEGSRQTVSEAIEAYEQFLRFEKQNKPSSVATTLYRFKGLLRGLLGVEVATVTGRKAEKAYRDRVREGSSAATHRAELRETRTLWRWLVKKGWAVANPWTEVEAVGKVRRGKEQLRGHEAVKLADVALARARGIGIGSDHWAESRRIGGLAVLTALTLGFRPSEVVRLEPRDVGGGELFISKGKTWKSVRRVKLPALLGRLLKERVQAVQAAGGSRLFPHDRDWVRAHTMRLCKAAGVPVVCAHALRGMHATLATECGETGAAVAKQLGHDTEQVAKDHYIAPGATEEAEREKILDVLKGTFDADPGTASETKKPGQGSDVILDPDDPEDDANG